MTKENEKPVQFLKCRVKFTKDSEGKAQFNIKQKAQSVEEAIHEITGVRDEELANEIITAGALALPERYDQATRNNIAYQTLADMEPRDGNEARLCLQSAALYSQGMNYLRRAELALGDGTFAKDHWNTIFMNNAVRLLSLHTKTVEALARYRQRGEQRITVVHQNVNVEGGGKAIVNNSVAVGEGQTKTNEVPHGQSRVNPDMPGKIQEIGEPLPQLCHERQTGLSDSWREKHGVENKRGQAATEGSQHQARTEEQGGYKGTQGSDAID